MNVVRVGFLKFPLWLNNFFSKKLKITIDLDIINEIKENNLDYRSDLKVIEWH